MHDRSMHYINARTHFCIIYYVRIQFYHMLTWVKLNRRNIVRKRRRYVKCAVCEINVFGMVYVWLLRAK
jgi:heterodisulfide reductase subunit B